MKKKLLILACLFLSIAGRTIAAEVQNPQTNTDVKQKACQNVFSLVNIDLSVMSPRAMGADISATENQITADKKGVIVPIANVSESKQSETKPQNKTSLFRVDLLHIFKIQIL